MKTLNPDMKLDGFSLRQALESIYSTFANVLLASGATDCPDLYRQDIPGMVFDVAVGAGWVPLADPSIPTGTGKGEVVWQADFYDAEKVHLPETALDDSEDEKRKGRQPPAPATYTKYQLARLLQWGDFIVERKYAASFYALLKDTIAFHLAEGTEHDEHLKQLPKTTSKKDREALLQKYIAKETEKAEGRRITMKEISRRADVDYTVLKNWRKGPTPHSSGPRRRTPKKPILDSSPPGQRLLLLLLFDERGKARWHRRKAKADPTKPTDLGSIPSTFRSRLLN